MRRKRPLASLAAFGALLVLSACRDAETQPQRPMTANPASQSVAQSRPNRLAREKSPYLLQHAHNPVDWFAWGEEAFAKARRENKPIFLSIGYSTCHWCHVMERESFEDEKIGAYLNEHFVSIKVDREERPDVDKIYMNFVQATTGGGGWPLNVFLTPDRKPFFGGTYFPPDNRHGRGSFRSVLEQIVVVWRERQSEVTASAEEIQARLEVATAQAAQSSNRVLTAALLQNAGQLFKDGYDPRYGGFGGAPKFPQPSIPSLLFRYAQRFDDAEATRMVLHTCERMAAGGIHDHLGGGFARYSVDAEWLVPHFEKMLYDNAQLAQLYLDAFLVSGEPRHATVVRDILDYVLRDMTHPEGGFYSAEDADSEGHEGKFYCWTHEELAKLLSPEEFNVATRFFGVTKAGNFVDHSHPSPLPGQNVLSIVDPSGARTDGALLDSARAKMLATRARRIRPHLDDKILASWNGLMLGAMARAGVVLGEERYQLAAAKNAAFLRSRLWDSATKTLYHRWREGERDRVELLEGHAFLLAGMVELYESTLEPEHLDFAIQLAESLLSRYYDSTNGGFWQATGAATDLILRVKDDYDGAEPSGNSVATLGLFKLAAITGREDFRKPAEATLRWAAPKLERAPQAVPFMLQALDFSLQEPRRVVIVGDPRSAQTQELLRATHSVYQPNKVVLGNTGKVEPFARTLPTAATVMAYVCTGEACQPPTQDPATLRVTLR
jgi:uncharacterized protein YyaL (SSP411 family)